MKIIITQMTNFVIVNKHFYKEYAQFKIHARQEYSVTGGKKTGELVDNGQKL